MSKISISSLIGGNFSGDLSVGSILSQNNERESQTEINLKKIEDDKKKYMQHIKTICDKTYKDCVNQINFQISRNEKDIYYKLPEYCYFNKGSSNEALNYLKEKLDNQGIYNVIINNGIYIKWN